MAEFFISHREKDVIWRDLVNVTAQPTANDLEKTSGGAVWNAGARSVQTLAFGGVSFKAGQIDKNIMCGLSSSDPDQDKDTIEFGIFCSPGGQISVFENGSNPWATGVTYNTNTVLSVEVNISTGAVEYKKDGNVQYTSLNTPTYPLFVDNSIFDVGAQILDVQMLNGKTISIDPLESFSVSRAIEFFQGIDETPGGDVKVGDLGPQIQFVRLIIETLSVADRVILDDFILNFAAARVNFFDFTDDLGVDYDKVRFVMDTLDLLRSGPQTNDGQLLLRQDVS